MTLSWFSLAFPADVEAEAVGAWLRTLGAQPRSSDGHGVVALETRITAGGVQWLVGCRQGYGRRLKLSSEASLPGISWERATWTSPRLTRAAALRVMAPDRLLAVDHAEAATAGLLRLSHELRANEQIVVQWMVGQWLVRSPIRPVSEQVPAQGLGQIAEWGRPVLDAEQVQAARKKSAEHVFACAGRIGVTSADRRRDRHLLSSTAGALQLLRAPGVGVSRRALPSWWVRRRFGDWRVPSFGPACRLTATELAGLIGWPIGNPRLPGVRYVASRVLPLDDRCMRAELGRPEQRIVGRGVYGGQADSVAVLPARASIRHLHVIGPTGVGKSTLLTRLILADIAAGRGAIVIDPKGDLVTSVLERVRPEDQERVVVLDPSDPAPVGFNPLEGGAVGIDGVLHVLRSVWTDAWGPRLGDVLLSSLLTLAISPGHTLAELPLLLSDAAFRRPLVADGVQHDALGLGTFWPWFEALSPDARAQVLAPVMSRMRALLLRPELRAVLGQSQPRFHLRQVFTERKVLLVRLPKGSLGSDGAQLIGSLLVAHLWRLTQGRSAIPAERRHVVGLYLDEFQEFLRLPLDLSDVLVQARGLGLALTLAHQHLGQLDPAVKAAVLANAGSRVIFRSDYDDAAALAKRSAGRLKPEDLMGLPAFQAYASLLADDEPTPYGSLRTLPLGPPTARAERLLVANRERYGVARGLTEQYLADLAGGQGPAPAVGRSGSLGARRREGHG